MNNEYKNLFKNMNDINISKNILYFEKEGNFQINKNIINNIFNGKPIKRKSDKSNFNNNEI